MACPGKSFPGHCHQALVAFSKDITHPKMQQTCTRLEAWRIDTVYSNTKHIHISEGNKNISPLAVAELAE